MKIAFPALLLVVALTGCATVQMGDAQQDAALKTFAVPKGKSGIYIYRNESMGGAITMEVTVDGQPIGATGAKTYLYREVNPGKHTITSKAENTDTLTLTTQAGRGYFVWQEVKFGVIAGRTQLHLVDDATGKKGVAETSLAVGK